MEEKNKKMADVKSGNLSDSMEGRSIKNWLESGSIGSVSQDSEIGEISEETKQQRKRKRQARYSVESDSQVSANLITTRHSWHSSWFNNQTSMNAADANSTNSAEHLSHTSDSIPKQTHTDAISTLNSNTCSGDRQNMKRNQKQRYQDEPDEQLELSMDNEWNDHEKYE